MTSSIYFIFLGCSVDRKQSDSTAMPSLCRALSVFLMTNYLETNAHLMMTFNIHLTPILLRLILFPVVERLLFNETKCVNLYMYVFYRKIKLITVMNPLAQGQSLKTSHTLDYILP